MRHQADNGEPAAENGSGAGRQFVRKPMIVRRFHWPLERKHALNAISSTRYCGQMDDRRLQLAELLDFRPDEGIIRLHEQRVVILSAAAMGLLRKELIDTLGAETARRLLMRFGFADGYHDAVSLRDRAAWSNPLDGLRTGAVVHTLEGIVRVRSHIGRIRSRDRPLRGRGRVARFLRSRAACPSLRDKPAAGVLVADRIRQRLRQRVLRA